MIEAGISAAIALITGVGFITQKLHSRILELDHRIDDIELRVAQQYVTKSELGVTLTKIEEHMLRIENKIDKLTINRFSA